MLNAPVLSRDKRLLRTVYGPDADVDALANWLGLALDGRVMGETDVQSWAMTGAGELAIRGGFAAGEALLRLFLRLPLHIQLLILGAAIGGAVLARKALTNAARATGETAKEFLKETIWPAIATMLAEREFAAQMLIAAAPSGGDGWRSTLTVLLELPTPGALLRLCLYTLARASTGSAAALSRGLPTTPGIASGEAKVRAVLRSHRCFHPVGRGRFQVGRPAISSAAATQAL